MELFLLYIWLKLTVLSNFFMIVCACGAFSLFLLLLAEEGNLFKHKYFKRLVVLTLSSLMISGLIPSKTDVAVLVGGYYALKLSDTPEASKVMSVLRLKANELLDEQIQKSTK